MQRFLVVSSVLAALLLTGVASADPVQEFSFQLRNVKPDGRYSLVFTSRSYDTTGGQPPQVSQNYLRLPLGVALRGAFLGKAYRCDVNVLRASLIKAPESDVSFGAQVKDLKATLGRIRGKLEPDEIANIETCIRAQVGSGRTTIDARPYFKDPIPADVTMFLARGTEPGAIASFGIVAAPDESAAVVRDNPAVSSNRSVFNTNIFNDPTPDGLYGYRMELPSGPIGGLKISISELTVTTSGLSTVKSTVTCLKKRRGRCIKRKVTKSTIFWITQPKCPASGNLSFLAYYLFEGGLESTKTVALPCPAFTPR